MVLSGFFLAVQPWMLAQLHTKRARAAATARVRATTKARIATSVESVGNTFTRVEGFATARGDLATRQRRMMKKQSDGWMLPLQRRS